MKLNVFMVAGIALMFFGLIYPMVTLVIDNTPPIATAYYPDVGATYVDLKLLQVSVRDPESGIKSVKCTIGGTTYTLSYYQNDPYSPYWEIWRLSDADFPDITQSGEYTVTWEIINRAGLKTTKSGSFTIYIDLQGDWYVQNTKIADPTQTLYLTSTTVTFKFVKTQGIEDSKISCWVEEGGTRILTLDYNGNGVWVGSYTFEPGTHTLNLVAADPWKSVTMSIINLDFGGEETIQLPAWLNMQTLLILIGGVLAAYGFIRRS